VAGRRGPGIPHSQRIAAHAQQRLPASAPPAREAADLPWVGFHAFRHTCASILFAEGRNAVQVQRWLGHHSAAFTLATYVHLLDGDLGEPLTIPQTVHNDAK
jgi:integrase